MITKRTGAVGVAVVAGLIAISGLLSGGEIVQIQAVEPELLQPPRREKDDKKDDNKAAGKEDDNGKGNGKAKGAPVQPILPQSYPGGLYPAVPVTLPEVLKLAVLANLDVTQANLVVQRARVALLRARAQYLPDLTYGVQQQSHDGAIQKTEGNIIFVDRDSLFVGGGPTMTLDTSAALFGPRQARALLEAAQFGQGRITLDVLVRVADAYFAVLRARRQLARLDEVLDMLTSEQESELRGKSKGLLPLIQAFVKAGTALPSDQARVEADVVRRHGERILALEQVRTASAELSRLLHLNAAYFLLPIENPLLPVQAPGEAWFVTPIEGLIGQALRGRPELAENQALVEAAVLRYKQAKWQPLLPRIDAGLAWGGFGGGPELLKNRKGTTYFGDSGNISNFDTRTDVNLAATWQLQNMGLGNVARIRDARLEQQQAQVRLLFQQDLIVTQVVQSMESVQRGKARYNVYRAGLFDDAGNPVGTVYRSLRLNFVRIKGGQGLPLEVLDSTRRLSDVLQGYADTVTDYDRSRYRLLLALGLPPQALLDPSCMPAPPASGPPGPVPATPVPQPTAAPATKPQAADARPTNVIIGEPARPAGLPPTGPVLPAYGAAPAVASVVHTQPDGAGLPRAGAGGPAMPRWLPSPAGVGGR